VFHRTAAPSTQEVQALVDEVARRIDRLMVRRGLLDDEDEADEDGQKLMMEASAAGRVALGARAGRKPRVLRGPPRPGRQLPARCAQAGWFNLHAGVALGPHDDLARERLIRYVARPPLARDRLTEMEDGRYLVRFKRAWDDGTSAVIFDGVTLLERLSALVHPPGSHRVVYAGVFGSASKWRAEVVPPKPERERHPLHAGHGSAPEPSWARWIPWRDLLWRVFSVEPRRCPNCERLMGVHAVVMGFWATRRVLSCLGLPTTPWAPAPSRAPPQLAWP